MGVTSYATLPFPPETHVFSTAFKLLQANSTLFKHLWLVTPVERLVPGDVPAQEIPCQHQEKRNPPQIKEMEAH